VTVDFDVHGVAVEFGPVSGYIPRRLRNTGLTRYRIIGDFTKL